MRSLYAKLSLVLFLLLLTVGAIYLSLSFSFTRDYMEEVNQRVSRDLAKNLVMDRNLVQQGNINQDALKETFTQYMVVNPSIEIYLLDLDGNILSYSAEPGRVKRKQVSLIPIKRFLQSETFPLLGDDPRSHDRSKAFSVTPVPNSDKPEGYLYVVLQGEEYDSVHQAVKESFVFQQSLIAIIASLIFGLLAGLILFYALTRRLHNLSHRVQLLRQNDFLQPPTQLSRDRQNSDEIDQLTLAVDEMANRIHQQLTEINNNDQNRRDMVAQVSHDLRTPLASLRGYLETLQIKESSLSREESRECIEIALKHAKRLSKLIDQLFELARLESVKQLAQSEPFSMAELAHDVAHKFHLQAKQKNISLQVDVQENTAFVDGDIALIERVLENLLENALRHTPENGDIRLTLQQDQQQMLIKIKDSGRGISRDDIGKVFERFFQANNAHREGGHAGLGLAIVKQILQLHQSHIEVASEEDQGTEFKFNLPLHAA